MKDISATFRMDMGFVWRFYGEPYQSPEKGSTPFAASSRNGCAAHMPSHSPGTQLDNSRLKQDGTPVGEVVNNVPLHKVLGVLADSST